MMIDNKAINFHIHDLMKTVEGIDLQVFEKAFLHRLFYFIFDSHVNN